MVAFYQVNPHIQTALDFARDDWTRFMHNVHTPAPYGYGWTIFSVLPYLLGFNKFFLSWMIFRLLSLSSIGLLFLCLRWLALKLKLSVRLYQLAFLFLNPLFLIEIISNSHNDLWMLLPAMLSLGLVSTTRSTRLSPKTTLISITLMALSISIKLATVILIPVWLVLFAKNNLLLNKINQTKLPSLLKTSLVWLSGGLSKLLNLWWPLAASLLMFLPLMTARSKQFLPWYLVWALVWLPLIRWKPWKYLLLIFSISSLFRYLPWMLAGNFDGDVITHQKLITWLIPAAIFFIWLLKKSFQKSDSPIPLEGKSI